jgi:rfaE bifunctional protein nucleotidyltransferase chain/domain
MMANRTLQEKILTLKDLADRLGELRAASPKLKVAHCHGVFDLIHVGHIKHFQEARAIGDVLVVTLTPDQYVNKGPHRPVFTQTLRAEALAALEMVDYVAINEWPTAIETIRLLKPNFYVKGPDYRDSKNDVTGKIIDEEEAVKGVGGEIYFTEDVTFSSTALINKHFEVFPPQVKEYLQGFATRFKPSEVIAYLEKARNLKVLIVGETIIDEYQYVVQIGKSAKEPILAVRHIETDVFAGGALAVANHVASFASHVTLLTMLGAQESRQEFASRALMPNVQPVFIYKPDSPTIVKRRFIEHYLLQKLFEVYEMNDDILDDACEADLLAKLDRLIGAHDLVIAIDYGHGMIGDKSVEMLCAKAPFLAVNTQANAGNRGFNTISKYPRADFVSIARHELALETRNRSLDDESMALRLNADGRYGQLLVTVGKDGILGHSVKDGFVRIPALATHVVDRVGAGDAVLSVASLLAAQQVPLEVMAFVGNLAGAEAVSIMGNERALDKVSLFKHIESLLK